MDPSLRVAVKIRPYFILVLDGGPATARRGETRFRLHPTDEDLSAGAPGLAGFSLATLRVSIGRYALGCIHIYICTNLLMNKIRALSPPFAH